VAVFGLTDNHFPLADLQEQFVKHCRQTVPPADSQECMSVAAGRLIGCWEKNNTHEAIED
jgi:hypothetical protein